MNILLEENETGHRAALTNDETCLHQTVRRYFRLDRRDLAYLTFILESYEGLATLSTVEKKKETLVCLTPGPGLAADLDDLVRALQREITMTEAAPPPDEHAAEGDRDA